MRRFRFSAENVDFLLISLMKWPIQRCLLTRKPELSIGPGKRRPLLLSGCFLAPSSSQSKFALFFLLLCWTTLTPHMPRPRNTWRIVAT